MAIIGVHALLGGSWDGLRAATCMPTHCFCEAIHPGIVRQPANAVSSLAFAVVSAMVLITGFKNRSASRNSAIEGLSGYALVYAAALMAIGIGSAFYHASLSFIGQFADVMGMYLLATFIILYAIGRMMTLSIFMIVGGYLVTNAGLGWLLFTLPSFRRYAFALVLLAGLIVELMARRTPQRRLTGRLLLSAFAALTIGFVFWVLDITGVMCVPGSLLQGHALWHVAGAVASWQVYVYYRSEQHETLG